MLGNKPYTVVGKQLSFMSHLHSQFDSRESNPRQEQADDVNRNNSLLLSDDHLSRIRTNDYESDEGSTYTVDGNVFIANRIESLKSISQSQDASEYSDSNDSLHGKVAVRRNTRKCSLGDDSFSSHRKLSIKLGETRKQICYKKQPHLRFRKHSTDSNLFSDSQAMQATITETSIFKSGTLDHCGRATCSFMEHSSSGKIYFYLSRLRIKNLSSTLTHVPEILVHESVSKIKKAVKRPKLCCSSIQVQGLNLLTSFHLFKGLLCSVVSNMTHSAHSLGNLLIAHINFQIAATGLFFHLKRTDSLKVVLDHSKSQTIHSTLVPSLCTKSLIHEDKILKAESTVIKSGRRLMERFKNEQHSKSFKQNQPRLECLVDVNNPATSTSVSIPISSSSERHGGSFCGNSIISEDRAEAEILTEERGVLIYDQDLSWSGKMTFPKKSLVERYLMQNVEGDGILGRYRNVLNGTGGYFFKFEDIPTRDESGLCNTSSVNDKGTTRRQRSKERSKEVSKGESNKRSNRAGQQAKFDSPTLMSLLRSTWHRKPGRRSSTKSDTKNTETESFDTSRESDIDDEINDTSTYKKMTVRALLKKYERLTNELNRTNRTIDLLLAKSCGYKSRKTVASRLERSNIVHIEAKTKDRDYVDDKSSQSTTISRVSEVVIIREDEKVTPKSNARAIPMHKTSESMDHGTLSQTSVKQVTLESTMLNNPVLSQTTVPDELSSTIFDGIAGNRPVGTHQSSVATTNPYAPASHFINSTYGSVSYPTNVTTFTQPVPMSMPWSTVLPSGVVVTDAVQPTVTTEIGAGMDRTYSRVSADNSVVRVHSRSLSRSEHRVEKRNRHKALNHRACHVRHHECHQHQHHHHSHRAKSQCLQHCEANHSHMHPCNPYTSVQCHRAHNCLNQCPGPSIQYAHMFTPFGSYMSAGSDVAMNSQYQLPSSHSTCSHENWLQSHALVKHEQPHIWSHQMHRQPIQPSDGGVGFANPTYQSQMTGPYTTAELNQANKDLSSPYVNSQHQNTQSVTLSHMSIPHNRLESADLSHSQTLGNSNGSTIPETSQVSLSTLGQEHSHYVNTTKLASAVTPVPAAFQGRSIPRSPLPEPNTMKHSNQTDGLQKPDKQPTTTMPQMFHGSSSLNKLMENRTNLENSRSNEYPNQTMTYKNRHQQEANPVQSWYHDSTVMHPNCRMAPPTKLNDAPMSVTGSLPVRAQASDQPRVTMNPAAQSMTTSHTVKSRGTDLQPNYQTHMSQQSPSVQQPKLQHHHEQKQPAQTAQAVIANRANLPHEPSTPEEWKNVEYRYDQLQKQKTMLEGQLCRLPQKSSVGIPSVSKEEERLMGNLSRIDRELSALRLLMRKRYAQTRVPVKAKA